MTDERDHERARALARKIIEQADTCKGIADCLDMMQEELEAFAAQVRRDTMNTLPVKWAMELHEERPEPEPLGDGSAFETVPRAVVEVKDLDALREGLGIAALDMCAMPPDVYQAWLDSGSEVHFRQWMAQRLLAMLPKADGMITKQISGSGER